MIVLRADFWSKAKRSRGWAVLLAFVWSLAASGVVLAQSTAGAEASAASSRPASGPASGTADATSQAAESRAAGTLAATQPDAGTQSAQGPAAPRGGTPFAADGNSNRTPFSPTGGAAELWQTAASLALVIALAAGGLILVKRVLPRLGKPLGRRQIRVLETAYLGPRKTVHLLQVGRKKYLVAGTRERLSLLAEVPEERDGPDDGPTEEPRSSG